MRETLFGLCAFAALACAASSSKAQSARNCADRERVVTRLAESYGEVRQSIGLGTNNSIVEVFASNETGTWTITVTSPSGITCLVATGQAFEMTRDVLEPAKKDV